MKTPAGTNSRSWDYALFRQLVEDVGVHPQISAASLDLRRLVSAMDESPFRVIFNDYYFSIPG